MGGSVLPGARFQPPAIRSIVRERVDRRLDLAWDVPLTTVVGPAGAGKTTAASNLVRRSPGDVVWYRAHPVDSEEPVLAAHLAEAIQRTTGRTGAWPSFDALVIGIEQAIDRLLVIIDEFDALIGTPAEHALDRALVDLPPTFHLITLSRQRPSLNLTRLRLGAGVVEIGPDELRFRSWEIDRLFRELYQRPLRHDEVAELERRTGGWVAALQLFNLATSTLPVSERHRAIAFVGRRSGPDWDFLADNVIAGLSDQLQLFLLETAPLERLTATLCDDLLGEQSSARSLAELERLQLLTGSFEAPGTFRSHEVLRAHLDALVMEREGADAGQKRYRRAAEVLERHGYFAEALRAYCLGEDWPSASRLLGSRGAEVAEHPGRWLGSLPPALVQSDPWLLLALARQQRADGRLHEAIATFQRVERSALSSLPVTVARRERLLLTSLLDRASFPSLAWVAALRDAVVNDPVIATSALTDRTAPEMLASGVCQLLAGEVAAAEVALRRARDRPDASPTVALAAELGLLVAAHLAGTSRPLAADDLERSAIALDVPFLVRLSRAVAGMVSGALPLLRDVVDDSERVGDQLGAAFAATFDVLARVWGPAAPADVASDALERCRDNGLRTLEVWVQVAVALGSIGGPEGPALAAVADAAARRRGLRALQDLAGLAVLAATPAANSRRELAEALTASHGFSVPPAVHRADSSATGSTAAPGKLVSRLAIRCLGGFTIERDGTPISLSGLRPRARAVLRMLAVHLGGAVHRQVLCDELWRDDDEGTALRKLHVAVSSIRRAFDLEGYADLILRQGDVYLLNADGPVDGDVRAFSVAVGQARSVGGRDAAEAEPLLRHALDLYGGELLPEDGAAEWVVPLRQQLQADATEAAHALGSILLETARPGEAVGVARWGLAVDRYYDPLWRLLLTALDANGDSAEHARALARYESVLRELGISGQQEPVR
jgi:DNA-binding SARP family transcriptional activator